MSSIQLGGLFSGIDSGLLVSQLMAVERRTLQMYEARQAQQEEKKDALTTLQTKVSDLRSAVSALSDSSELRAFNTTSSDTDILTAEASYNSYEGNHNVVINQLANAERWVHTSGKEYAEDYVGEGTFIYSYNNEEAVLTTTTETTLDDLVGLINNDANNPGVTANLLFYNETYHLVLNGNDAGTNYEVQINDYNTELWQANSAFTVDGDNATLSTKLTQLDQFSGTFVGDEYVTISGNLHDGTAVSQNYSVNDNTKLSHIISEINDVFGDQATATLVNGEICLVDNTCGTSQMTLALAYNQGTGSTTLTMPTISRATQGGSVAADLSGFSNADFTETQSAQDCQVKVDGYPAGVDEWISRSSNTIDDVIHGVTLHLHDTTDASGVQVNLSRDTESIKEKIQSMADAYNSVVDYIQKTTGYDSDTKTAGVLIGDYIISTLRSQLRSPLISQTNGFVEDIDTFLTPGQIGLELDSDGLLNFDTNDFDEAIAEDYMSVLDIIGADKSGSSDSNIVKFYGASSDYTTAENYDVCVVVSGGNLVYSTFKLTTESMWHGGTCSGNIATANSTFDDNGDPVYPENGLQVSVDLSQNGSFYATVRVKQGFAGAMEDAMDKMLKATTGSIPIDITHTDDKIELLEDKIEAEEARLTKKEARMVARYARLEKTLALLQSQLAALGLSMESS